MEKGVRIVKLFEEMTYDLDFTRPRVIVSDGLVILENVEGIVMLSETTITVRHGMKLGLTENARTGGERGADNSRRKSRLRWFTTITGSDFAIREIYEGRLLIEGTIQRAEFLQSQG